MNFLYVFVGLIVGSVLLNKVVFPLIKYFCNKTASGARFVAGKCRRYSYYNQHMFYTIYVGTKDL